MNSQTFPLRTLSIGDVAKRTGLKVSAIRYYEEEGLIQALRSRGGNRRFLRAEIRKVSFIAISQKLGFSLSEIRHHLSSLPLERAPTKADWEKISGDFRDVLNARIAAIERLRDRLDGCIGCGCLSLENCAIYNASDHLGKEGSGARLVTANTID